MDITLRQQMKLILNIFNIMSMILGKECIMNKLPAFSSTIYYTYISKIETNDVNQKLINHNMFIVFQNRLGHHKSIMMRKTIENSYGHTMKN